MAPRPSAQTGRVVDPGSGAAASPPRWRLLVLIVAVVLLFAYVLTHRLTDTGVGTAAERPPENLPELTGPRGTGPEGLLVLVGGQSAGVLDTHTGALTPVPGLQTERGDRAQLRPVPSGVLAVLTNDRGSRAVLLRKGAAVPLGTDVRVVPTRRGDLALASQRNGQTTVQLRASDGTPRERWTVRGLAAPVRDTVGGLLLTRLLSTGSSGAELLLVDPRTGAERRKLGADRVLLGATDTLVAHRAGSCTVNCDVTVSDLATGKDRQLSVVLGAPAATGAFSPDGDRLALSVPGLRLDGGWVSEPGFVAVQDVADGRTTVVPGVKTPPGQQADVDWSPEGDVLVVAVWWPDRALIGLWSPAEPGEPPVVLAARPPGDRFSGIAATSG